MNTSENPRIAYDLIISEVPRNSKVLDLGCGNGELLDELNRVRQVIPYGVEISEDGVFHCVEKGFYCYQGDIDEGLADYRDNSFDYVILNQTLQITKRPAYVLQEMMRISKNAIISFPNFGYIRSRTELMVKGTMPKNVLLPYEWYETPNIHLLTIKDFHDFCREKRYPVKREHHFSMSLKGRIRHVGFFYNFLAQYGFFVLDGEQYTDKKN